jgi:hypothetical protein
MNYILPTIRNIDQNTDDTNILDAKEKKILQSLVSEKCIKLSTLSKKWGYDATYLSKVINGDFKITDDIRAKLKDFFRGEF